MDGIIRVFSPNKDDNFWTSFHVELEKNQASFVSYRKIPSQLPELLK